MTDFRDEKDFDTFYDSLNDPKREVEELAKWRQFQMRVVSKFIQQIRLIANDQYTNLDHFLLELLQNADDNAYLEGVEKTFKLTLTEDSVIIENNEVGFSSRNLYAITYSGASTKTRTKTSRTYIGEKGIGFKSVFAVAEHVDIHSPPYHFRLCNDEYIVPHPLSAEKVNGTRIVIRLKPSGQGIREILAARIESLARGAQEFTLFLQQLERLELADHMRGTRSTVLSARDDAKGYYVIEHDGKISEYVKLGYERTIPREIAKTRFDEIDQDIAREVTFAVPMSPEDGSDPANNGMLFCFLPTGVSTGLPIHIQVDAKTITNRENIQSFATSDWNRALFDRFSADMCRLYVDLSQYPELRDYLPAYWPQATSEKNIGNADLEALLGEVEDSLGKQPIFLDRHGEFREREEVRMMPPELAQYLNEDRCEEAVTHFLVGYFPDSEMEEEEAEGWAEEIAENRITFVSPVWQEKYSDRLEELDVEYLDHEDVEAALADEPPSSIDVLDDVAVRAFLTAIMDYDKHQWRFDAKALPIFPVIEDGVRVFASIDETTMWLQTDSSRVPSKAATRVIDPSFTYSPGGGQQKEGRDDEVRAFNQRFRKYLADSLEVPSYSEEELLRRSLIPELTSLDWDISKKDQRDQVVGLWKQLFAKIWRRQKTIVKDSGEDKLKQIFKELGSCKIPTRAAGTREWSLTPVTSAFLSKRFRVGDDLEKGYSRTGAPIIDLGPLESQTKKKRSRKKTKVDWEQWRDFLLQCGANDGPYLIRRDLFSIFGNTFRIESDGEEGATGLAHHLQQRLRQHSEFMASREKTISLRQGSETTSLDEFTQSLIDEHRHVPGGLNRLGNLFQVMLDDCTVLKFVWGWKQNSRTAKLTHVIALDQISGGVVVQSTRGEVQSPSCYLKSAENERILGDLAPMVDGVGLEEDFLSHIGVRGRVTVESLQELIDQWFDNSDPSIRNVDAFLPFIEAIATYALLYPQDEHKLTLKAKLYDPHADSLVPVEDWLNRAVELGYAEHVVVRLSQALQLEQQRTPSEALKALFSLDDLAADSELTLRLLVDLGKHIEDGAEDLGDSFKDYLSENGLVVAGRRVNSLEHLPPIWDRVPSPLNDEGLLVLHSSTRQRKRLRTVSYELGWPYLGADTPVELDAPGSSPLDAITARRVHLSVSELRDDVKDTRPSVARRIDGFKVFENVNEVQERMLQSDSLWVKSEVDGRSIRCEVPYWLEGGHLVIQRSRDVATELPRFLDENAGTTVTGIFRYLWDAKEKESRVFEPGEEAGGSVNPPDYPGKGYTGGGGGAGEPHDQKGDLEEDIFSDPDEQEDDPAHVSDDEQDKDEEPVDPKNPPRRKRLNTVVQVTPGSGGISDTESGGSADHNKKVEDAGRERFIAYLEDQGAQVVSREAENVGYDFEVTVGEEVFYVELKSSQDQWEGWEHSLSANEFKKALELGEKYFLCAVDYAYNDEGYQFYFIRDPANQVANFAFDSPWKGLAIPMNDYLSRLKDKQGLVG